MHSLKKKKKKKHNSLPQQISLNDCTQLIEGIFTLALICCSLCPLSGAAGLDLLDLYKWGIQAFIRMSNEGVKHFSQATGLHKTFSSSLHLHIRICHHLDLFHVALIYLEISSSSYLIRPPPTLLLLIPLPPQNWHLLLPWLPCFQGNSKTEKQCVSGVTNTSDMCVFTSVDPCVCTHANTHKHIHTPSPTHQHTQPDRQTYTYWYTYTQRVLFFFGLFWKKKISFTANTNTHKHIHTHAHKHTELHKNFVVEKR